MKLKPLLDSLEGVPEALHEAYEKLADGKFRLVLDGNPPGFVEKSKLDEFRNNNIELNNKLKEFETKLSGVDLEEYSRLKGDAEKNRDKKLIEEGKIEELLAQRTEAMRKSYESQTTALKTALDKEAAEKVSLTGHLSRVLIDSEIGRHVTKVGQLRKGALNDVLARATRIWKVQEGKPVAMDGDQPLYGKNGREALSMEEWCQQLVEEAPYLFESSNGGGGSGGKHHETSGRTIAVGDNRSFIANLDKIAKGEVTVVGTAAKT